MSVQPYNRGGPLSTFRRQEGKSETTTTEPKTKIPPGQLQKGILEAVGAALNKTANAHVTKKTLEKGLKHGLSLDDQVRSLTKKDMKEAIVTAFSEVGRTKEEAKAMEAFFNQNFDSLFKVKSWPAYVQVCKQ